jgi:hypothetical protein
MLQNVHSASCLDLAGTGLSKEKTVSFTGMLAFWVNSVLDGTGGQRGEYEGKGCCLDPINRIAKGHWTLAMEEGRVAEWWLTDTHPG